MKKKLKLILHYAHSHLATRPIFYIVEVVNDIQFNAMQCVSHVILIHNNNCSLQSAKILFNSIQFACICIKHKQVQSKYEKWENEWEIGDYLKVEN